jgi:hypothetical protein
MTFLKGAVIFINKGSLVIGRLFKAVKTKVVNNIKGVIRRDLRQQLIIYKLKSPLVLINSLIFIYNYSVGLSS